MVTRVQKWGNSQGVRLSKELLAEAHIDVGDAVSIRVHDGELVLTPTSRVRGCVHLEELVERVPAGYRPGEADWGSPAGDEVW
jgi:antitoxin MazE